MTELAQCKALSNIVPSMRLTNYSMDGKTAQCLWLLLADLTNGEINNLIMGRLNICTYLRHEMTYDLTVLTTSSLIVSVVEPKTVS